MMGIKNTWRAYCFDSAIHLFGSHVQNEIDSVNEKNERAAKRKRDSILRRYIPELAKAQRFADPGKR